MSPGIDLLLRNVRIVTCTDDVCAITPPAFVAIFGGLIAGLGPMTQLDPDAAVVKEFDGEGALLTPGFIDCHTHLVHAGHRAREFEMRLQGASYEEIARAGSGGLMASLFSHSIGLPPIVAHGSQALQQFRVLGDVHGVGVLMRTGPCIGATAPARAVSRS